MNRVAWDLFRSIFIFTSSQVLDGGIEELREIRNVDLFICHEYFTFRADFVGVCARYQYILPSGTFIIQIPQNREGNIRLRLNYCVHSTEDVKFAVVSSAVVTKIHNRMSARWWKITREFPIQMGCKLVDANFPVKFCKNRL